MQSFLRPIDASNFESQAILQTSALAATPPVHHPGGVGVSGVEGQRSLEHPAPTRRV